MAVKDVQKCENHAKVNQHARDLQLRGVAHDEQLRDAPLGGHVLLDLSLVADPCVFLLVRVNVFQILHLLPRFLIRDECDPCAPADGVDAPLPLLGRHEEGEKRKHEHGVQQSTRDADRHEIHPKEQDGKQDRRDGNECLQQISDFPWHDVVAREERAHGLWRAVLFESGHEAFEQVDAHPLCVKGGQDRLHSGLPVAEGQREGKDGNQRRDGAEAGRLGPGLHVHASRHDTRQNDDLAQLVQAEHQDIARIVSPVGNHVVRKEELPDLPDRHARRCGW